jgi:S-adenosylmethionine decarboxylase proenzyme
MSQLGYHYIAELWDCPFDILDDKVRLEVLTRRIAESAHVTVLNAQFHQFSPYGVTGLLLLSESHLSVHTWPEHGYCAMDFFTCGDAVAARDAVLECAGQMKAGRLELRTVARGEQGHRRSEERRVLLPPFQWTTALSHGAAPSSDEARPLKLAHACAK